MTSWRVPRKDNLKVIYLMNAWSDRSRTLTIRLSAQNSTDPEILIFGCNSPLMICSLADETGGMFGSCSRTVLHFLPDSITPAYYIMFASVIVIDVKSSDVRGEQGVTSS